MLQVLSACQHGPARLQLQRCATAVGTAGKGQVSRRPGLPVCCNHNSSGNFAWSGNDGSGARSDMALAAQRCWLRRQRVLHSEPHPSDADIIELNVGGAVMVTSRSTLRQVPGSLLCLLFDPDNDQLLVKDTNGRVFLDHDPAVFSLVLRYLRELKVTGGCPSSVLLPAIPPSEASSFRSLAKYLGLQIAEAAITAAVLRGAAAATAAGGGGSGVGHGKQQGSPYASRPVAASPNVQQRWQQQQLVRPFPPDIPPSGWVDDDQRRSTSSSKSTASAAFDGLPAQRRQINGSSSSNSDSCAAASPEASEQSVRPDSRGLNKLSSSDTAVGDGVMPVMAGDDLSSSSRPQLHQPQSPSRPPSVAHGSPADPKVQSFYIKTATAPAAVSSAVPLQPLKVAVSTEADMMIQQQQQWQQRASGSSTSSKEGAAAGFADGGAAFSYTAAAASCDIFCTVSSSRQLLVFSFVAKSSAGLDNIFVGATSVNHIDQRGLQIPSFGWRKINLLAADVSAPADSAMQAAEAAGALAIGRESDESHALDHGKPFQQQQQQPPPLAPLSPRRRLWRSGDLVQVVLELGPVNRLLLKVNGQEAKGCHNMLDLPTFRQWCWYLALFRGTEVVAIVFEEGRFSIYNGDHRLKRFLQ